MENSSFLYYAPESQGRPQKHRGQHGQFLPYVASPQLLAPTPISPAHFPSQLVLGGRGIPLSITPSASPSLMDSYVAGDIYTDSAVSDLHFNPATPPLTHSAVSTPSIPYAMPTPISNHGWSSADEPSITTVAPYEVQLPGTPMEYLPVLPATIVKSNASPAPTIALNDMPCPALSPCSSQDSFSAESDFCDPKYLTILSPAPLDVNPDIVFPPMPTLNNDDSEFLFGGKGFDDLPFSDKPKPYVMGDYNEELSDLDGSEDDFIQSFEEAVFSSAKRVKYDDEDESEIENDQLPSPPMSTSSSRQGSLAPIKSPKQRKVMKKCEDDDEDCDEMTEEQRIRSFKFGNSCDDSDHSTVSSPCEMKPSGIPINPNVIRRGRKQSLTEDPSKTFVCHLCNRRFRRQEHLKRHFRSLHTEDKPFSCGECGKRFSRSDNLTQHSRIHGTGSVLLGVLTEGEVPVLGSQYSIAEESMSPEPLSIVVMDPTDSKGSSDDKKARRKRKRSDE